MTKRIVIAKSMEHATNFKLVNEIDSWENMTIKEFNSINLRERNRLNSLNRLLPKAIRQKRLRKRQIG